MKKHHKGMLFMLGAMFIFALVNALVKDQIQLFSSFQLVFFRSFFALIPCGLFFLMKGKKTHVDWIIHGKQALMGVIALNLIFSSVHSLPLAQSVALYFSSTFFLLLLSYPLLKERVSKAQFVGVGVGFVGVLIIANPSGSIALDGALMAVGGALSESVVMLYSRLLGRKEDPFLLTLIYSGLLAAVSLCFLPFFWHPPQEVQWLSLILLGVGGGVGQICVTFAYRYAAPGFIAPMIYSIMLWSILIDWIGWGVLPSLSLLFGSAIVIGAGLFVVKRGNSSL